MIQKNEKNQEFQSKLISAFPFLLFAFLLGTTLTISWSVYKNEKIKSELEFTKRTSEIESRILKRLHEHEKILLSAVGLFNSMGDVSRGQWRQYVLALELDKNFPGTQGLGYSEWLTDKEKNQHINKMRKEGLPDYTIKPQGERAIYTPVIYLEPLDWRNSRAIGFDVYSEKNRRNAINQAVNSGAPSITEKITLVQETETEKQNGIIMYFPVYKNNDHKSIKGLISTPIRMKDFIHGIFGKISNDIAFEIRDESQAFPENILFNSISSERLEVSDNFNPLFSREAKINIFTGRIWKFSFKSLPSFNESVKRRDASMILIFGTLLSFLLSFIAYSLSSARKKALILVEEKTAEIISKEAFLLLILNSTAEAIYGIDTHGNCTFCNKACLDLLGYDKPEELIGKNMHLMSHHSYANGEAYPVELCPIFDAFRKQTHSHCDREVLWRKDGTNFAAEYWSHPQYKNGELIGCVVTFIDIGARKKAQDELREVSDRLILATKAGQVGVWDYNINNNILSYDDQMFTLYGIRPSDFDGKYESWLKSLYPEDLNKINNEVKMAIEGVKDLNTEFRVVWPDNSIHNIRAMGIVRKDDKGKPFSMIGTNWDITDQKRIEEQAKMASKAKSEFLANMTHELRTPMTGVIGMTTLLLRSKLDEAQKRYTQGIVTCGQSLMKLINDILDFSKIEAKKLKLDSIDFNLQEILSPVLSSFSLQAREKGLQFNFHLSPQVPLLLTGDSFRIMQIFNNLIANAIKFTTKGDIDVNITLVEQNEQEAWIHFSVKDTGIGISDTSKAFLFQEFTQVDAGTARVFGGTGLGLAISKQLVEMMGGKIDVISKQDQGSEFWFVLKLAKQKNIESPSEEIVSAKDPEALHQSLRPFSGTPSILLVEDNETNQQMLTEILQIMNFHINIAVNGIEALKALASAHYDLVLMDIQMPLMDGFETTKRIRSPESSVINHKIPIIAISAHLMANNKQKCLELGMDDFVEKPIDIKLLRSVLEKHLHFSLHT